MSKTCLGCGKAYTHAQRWWHDKCQPATNWRIATNADATNEAEDATNKKECWSADKELRRDQVNAVVVAGADVGVVRTKNRRLREAYNAYQREYMKRRRAEKRA